MTGVQTCALPISGLLGETEVVREAVRPLTWTAEEKAHWERYQVGDRLLFGRDTRFFKRGVAAEVIAIDKNGVWVRGPNDREAKITRRQRGAFEVGRAQSLAVATGDRLLISSPREMRECSPLTCEGRWLPSHVEGSASVTKIDLLQGTLEMLIPQVLARGETHGWGIVDRLSQLSKNTLKLGEGSVYPSLYRMETKGWTKATWAQTDNNRQAKHYSLTRAGRKQLEAEQQSWNLLSAIIAEVMQKA